MFRNHLQIVFFYVMSESITKNLLLNEGISSNDLEFKLITYITVTSIYEQDIDPDNYDVLIVSPTMFNNFISKHHNCCWKRFEIFLILFKVIWYFQIHK